ncbi:MAG: [Fe-Fe] hydrogenase large subunit C-terminal domain-containing protein [Oscillospiraceae bacterium]
MGSVPRSCRAYFAQSLPAATIAKYIKEHDEGAKVIFIGPCTAKKMEFKRMRFRARISTAF